MDTWYLDSTTFQEAVKNKFMKGNPTLERNICVPFFLVTKPSQGNTAISETYIYLRYNHDMELLAWNHRYSPREYPYEAIYVRSIYNLRSLF